MATDELAAPLDATELEELRGLVRGPVVVQGDPGYEQARQVWNGTVDRRPAAIVECTGNADVAATIRFARASGLPLSVRGGAHNVAGTAVADGGIVVDLGRMNSVRVDLERQTVRAGGGARLGDLDHETQPYGLGVPAGVMSRTGVAGLTLHGGLGFLSRRLGLTCDSLVAADVVTAEGELLQVDETHHPDLLWALRGGGGNFGAVTSFEFRLHPVGPLVHMLIELYPLDDAATVLRGFREAMADAPEELMAIAIYWSAAPDEQVPEEWHGRPVLVIGACWSGDVDRGAEAVASLQGFAEPVATLLNGPLPFVVAQSLFDPEFPDGQRHYWKSIYVRDADDEVEAVLHAAAASRPSPMTAIDVWALGGALRREPEGGSAFAARDERILIGIESNWTDPADDEANVEWSRTLYAALKPFSSGGAYLNFAGLGEDADTLLPATFRENYERLQRVKATYDPENVFSSNLNIPPG